MSTFKAIYRMGTVALLFASSVHGATTILEVKGEVRVRHGLEERWNDAHKGDKLQDLDTILSEEGMVVIKTQDGSIFTMDSYSILDIGDLRSISRQEMFLFIMSQKVQKMPPRKNKKLHVGNVSSVHGEKQSAANTVRQQKSTPKWELEFNAVRAMYDQEYYPNTVVKLHKIINRYSNRDDCGLVSLYLGRSFEALEETGQAIDSYQKAIELGGHCDDDDLVSEAKKAIRRLSN
jgi:hypothetical protein